MDVFALDIVEESHAPDSQPKLGDTMLRTPFDVCSADWNGFVGSGGIRVRHRFAPRLGHRHEKGLSDDGHGAVECIQKA